MRGEKVTQEPVASLETQLPTDAGQKALLLLPILSHFLACHFFLPLLLLSREGHLREFSPTLSVPFALVDGRDEELFHLGLGDGLLPLNCRQVCLLLPILLRPEKFVLLFLLYQSQSVLHVQPFEGLQDSLAGREISNLQLGGVGGVGVVEVEGGGGRVSGLVEESLGEAGEE